MDKPVNVLAIDDEKNILATLERHCFQEAYQLTAVTEIDVFWETLARQPVKVVISDQRMPGINGVHLLREVKEKYPDVIRILLTGHTDMQAAEEAVNIGQVYRFLTKPWNADDLRGTIRKAIESYDMAEQNRRFFEDMRVANARLIKGNLDLQQLYEKQKEFTSTVSHELRTPLASIKMGLDIVLSGTPGPLTADQSNFLGRAKSNVDRLTRLINDILDLSKMESGRIVMKIVPGDLNQAIIESLEPQKSVAVNKGLRLEYVPDPALPQLPFDRDRLLQVFYNLVGNALKFTDNGYVRVAVKADIAKNMVTVRIEDSGPGIKASDIPRLFEKFQQLEGEVNHKSGGTGLGLVICKTIIECHGGKIWVESVQGEGSSFIFLLPINERRKG